jgi:hypothetical protein
MMPRRSERKKLVQELEGLIDWKLVYPYCFEDSGDNIDGGKGSKSPKALIH